MKTIYRLDPVAALAGLLVSIYSIPAVVSAPVETSRDIPDPLKPWTGWALWDMRDLDSPSPYHDPKQVLRSWPARLALDVDATGGRFAFEVTVFSEAWLSLPGDAGIWPIEVKANDAVVPVVEHAGKPAVKLQAGHYALAGAYRWQGVPQKIAMPAEIGILSLTLNGRAVELPVRDAQGFLWLQRDASTEETDKDSLSVKLNSLIEDGIPLWWRTDVELVVAGKSREESLGAVLPGGWKLASVESQIPVALDDGGHLKAQVRAGKWTVQLAAFRLDHPEQIAFAAGAKPAAGEQFVAFRAQPDFRQVEIVGIPAIDVSQTLFPDKWREYPVYRWDTGTAFRIDEKKRGMGVQKPAGLAIKRDLWLDQDGGGLTFRDQLTGSMQQVWRLDASNGQLLGSVRASGHGQLITRNPQNNALGVEVRDRELNLEATGRIARAGQLPASGWQVNADKLDVTLNLPPGWRLFALFGADSVTGDWLTAWTLLDLFLLLIFTLAVFRMWGLAAAVLGFLAFGLSYHEPESPRYVWLVLLIPLALLRVVPSGWGRKILLAGKWLSVLVLVLLLVPFLGKQIQQCLYPQLEFSMGMYPAQQADQSMYQTGGTRGVLPSPDIATESAVDPFSSDSSGGGILSSKAAGKRQIEQYVGNLAYDTKARIQTGPGVPDWTWRAVYFSLNGPVKAEQNIHPILIPMAMERALSMARVVLLLGLTAVLLGVRRVRIAMFRKGAAAASLLLVLACLGSQHAGAQLPSKELLESLRAHLTEKSDAYPTAADIPLVTLTLRDRKLTMEAEIHTAIRTAVPLPGRLPAWSPVTVKVDGQPEPTLRRDDEYLWVVLPAGVHHVSVEGLLLNLTDWQWTYHLRPRRVVIDAPGWQVGGVRPGDVPEAQVFFSRVRQAATGEANYDRPNLQTAVGVDRQLELGLVWQVRTTVSRLSPVGNAVSLRVPLLAGEQVTTSNAVVKEGFIEVRLGAQQKEFTWQGNLPIPETLNGLDLTLSTRPEDTWVERWTMIASPVWNVAITAGHVAPTFETGNAALVPVWKPWPGESVVLRISRPKAVVGATVTVGRGNHHIELGKRQRSSSLVLSLRCSLGEDFLIDLPAGAEATSLTVGNEPITVRKDGNKVIVPLKPGEQEVSLQWKTDTPLGFQTRADAVTLPVESANINTSIQVTDDRWVLWTGGPLRGPAVRFWGILLGSLLAAWVLGRLAHSPLRTHQWMLLAIGLTQISLPLALVVVGWLFFLAWRGSGTFQQLQPWSHNLLQVFLIGLTVVTIGIFIAIVAEGLLGSPEMFIRGNDSNRILLRWYEARCDGLLPQPRCFSVSIWWYRLSMLLWALWLAASLIRWLLWGWQQFSTGACFRRKIIATQPPALP